MLFGMTDLFNLLLSYIFLGISFIKFIKRISCLKLKAISMKWIFNVKLMAM